MSDVANRSRFAKRRLPDGSYLVWSGDQRTLFRLYGYDEDGSLSKQRKDGTWREVRGRCWAVEVLLSDYAADDYLNDYWPIVLRRDGLVVGVDQGDLLRYGRWETLTNGQERLADAWDYALGAAADGDWLAKFIEDARRRREVREP